MYIQLLIYEPTTSVRGIQLNDYLQERRGLWQLCLVATECLEAQNQTSSAGSGDNVPCARAPPTRWLGQTTSFSSHSCHPLPLNHKVYCIRRKDVSLYHRRGTRGRSPTHLRAIIPTSHTHPSHSQTTRLFSSSLSFGVAVPRASQHFRGV